ncbi:FAD:protein FMN transferase [Enterococcus malodoratus]|uniref:FAD:protein FMN transferase n=1 Tax=Enterococcus malodoratus TaxID=71451 RepID=UPI0020736F32|nr:FAD:protein FMN transferase [Enterococcus malodoratus]
MKKRILVLFFGLIAIVLTACGSSQPKINEKPYEDKQFLMGTYVQIRIYDDGKKSALQPAFNRVKELADKITVNQEGSEIDEINKQAGIKPVKVTNDMYYLLKEAYKYSQDSKGGFDMAIGSITSLWRIGFPDARKPAQSEIDQALKLVNYHDVEFNDAEKTVYLKQAGMKLDLGAIAKGYITDEVVKVLKEEDVTTAIIDLGGNVFVMGHSPRGDQNEDWTVGIQDPNQARNVVLGSVPESNMSLVTSGIYERYLEADGKTYHHLFNPKTGYPFDNDIAGVTIVSKKSIDGDGLSTAVFSMGVKDGLKYVEELKDTEAIFVTRDDKVYVTSGLKDRFELNKEAGYKMGNDKDLK